MKHTSASNVLLAIVVGATAGYLLQLLFVSGGLAMLIPPITLPATVVIAAVAVVVMAWPIRKAIRGTRQRPVNSLYASRVVVLAKASTLSGAILLGFTAGLALFVFTRPVTPITSTTVILIASIISSLLLLIAGLVAERFCTLPPDDTEGTLVGEAHG